MVFVTLPLDFGLRRHFSWRFVIADVPLPIIGSDFLAHYGLSPDCKHKLLLDRITSLSVREDKPQAILYRIVDLQNFPVPKTARDLRRFLGMVNFYRRFFPSAAKYQSSLNDALSGLRGSQPFAVQHFRHVLEARHCSIYTDHKPITYAFLQHREKLPPVQLNQLSFIGQFTTDIQHISGTDNVVADAFSRISYIAPPPVDLKAIAEAQKGDTELLDLQTSDNTLKLKKIEVPGSACDTQFKVTVAPGSCLFTLSTLEDHQTQPSPLQPFVLQTVTISIHPDIIGPLPPAKSYRYCDSHRPFPVGRSMASESITAEDVLQALLLLISAFGSLKNYN
ncbi:uncharacterized protein TNIN_383331 [Trichonephila inaurata madagascariensis]|uniref:Reverse transcriptase RNase H-like domain-containing protein n=1 Tax=Trichonephila inaurata madagascariensis TaxID=2747483 RepID=A0A8X6Y2D0_9ARAC|nr:uncharacterized protein TNIN_383331 [Trichonephila inaurata madagascariensis]